MIRLIIAVVVIVFIVSCGVALAVETVRDVFAR